MMLWGSTSQRTWDLGHGMMRGPLGVHFEAEEYMAPDVDEVAFFGTFLSKAS
jgi:hypothetical protein